jgi:hypothetical protein
MSASESPSKKRSHSDLHHFESDLCKRCKLYMYEDAYLISFLSTSRVPDRVVYLTHSKLFPSEDLACRELLHQLINRCEEFFGSDKIKKKLIKLREFYSGDKSHRKFTAKKIEKSVLKFLKAEPFDYICFLTVL